MLHEGRLQRVRHNSEHAVELIATARVHLRSAELLADSDPELAFAALYDSMRKALSAVLAHRGLRTTAAPGAHKTLIDAVRAESGDAVVLRPAQRLRVRRNQVEYPTGETARVDAEEVREELGRAGAIVEFAQEFVESVPPF